jgi:hypothetical protein
LAQSDMRVSAAICRDQEAHQRRIAETHSLESRRNIAALAAAAWEVKALAAEKREAGILHPLEKLDAEITREFADEAKAEKDKHAR